MTTESPLVTELRAAPMEFGLPATPAVYAEYEAFLATGRYPYNDTVKAFITERHNVPDDLGKALDRHIYLASGQHKTATMVAAEEAARADGWVAVTEIEPADGLVIELRRGTTVEGPLRVKPTGKDWAPWALLPKGKRTHGYDLARLVEQHRAYEGAKARGQVAMDGPAVVMARVAGARS